MTEYRLDAVIVSKADDRHARAVQREIRLRGGNCLILDSMAFTTDVSMTWRCGPTESGIAIDSDARGLRWIVNRETSVWWRRPRGHSLGGVFRHPSVLSFASNECANAFTGSLAHCCRRWVNPLPALYPTTKLYELRVAEEVGLNVPTTMVTTHPRDAEMFVSEPGRCCVFKTFMPGSRLGGLDARRFNLDEDLADVWRLKHCPVILQEFVEAVADVRVTIVGDDVFSAASKVNPHSKHIDGRMERTAAEPQGLRSQDVDKLLELTKRLGLVYAAIDLRLKKDGELVFLEVNPSGQFLWLEVEAGLPISASLAKYLVPHSSRLNASEAPDERIPADSPRSWEFACSK